MTTDLKIEDILIGTGKAAERHARCFMSLVLMLNLMQNRIRN